jgi:hypothetical protein
MQVTNLIEILSHFKHTEDFLEQKCRDVLACFLTPISFNGGERGDGEEHPLPATLKTEARIEENHNPYGTKTSFQLV